MISSNINKRNKNRIKKMKKRNLKGKSSINMD